MKMPPTTYRFISLLIVRCLIPTLLLTSCSSNRPDFMALYNSAQWRLLEEQQEMDDYVQPPVIVVPGIVSSSLVNELGEEVWFGPWYKALLSTFTDLALEIDPETLEPKPSSIKASTLPDSVLLFDFYGSLFDVLEEHGNYHFTTPGTPYHKKERRYYKFAYDWRYDNVHAANALDDFIEQVRKDYGRPDLKVDIIAHSMGGLTARYYMRYGTADVLNDNDFPVTQTGAQKVRRFVQLGAPNMGSMSALHQLINGYKVVIRTIPVEVIATMPSIYQLLPHPLHNWLINTDGRPLQRDLFDTNLWQRLEWGIFNPATIERIKQQYESDAEGERQVQLLQAYFEKHIERARRFVWSLTVPVPEIDYSIIAFGGNCAATPSRFVVEDIDGESFFRMWPKEIKHHKSEINYDRLMLEPGDDRVTKASMLARQSLNPALPRHKYSFFPLDYAFFLCHNHGQLTGNISFQDNLLNVLLERQFTEFSRQDVDTMLQS